MSKMEPTLRSPDRMRTLAVLGFLYGVVVAMVDYLLICNHYFFHAVHKCPAYASAASGIDESVLRTCI